MRNRLSVSICQRCCSQHTHPWPSGLSGPRYKTLRIHITHGLQSDGRLCSTGHPFTDWQLCATVGFLARNRICATSGLQAIGRVCAAASSLTGCWQHMTCVFQESTPRSSDIIVHPVPGHIERFDSAPRLYKPADPVKISPVQIRNRRVADRNKTGLWVQLPRRLHDIVDELPVISKDGSRILRPDMKM